MALEVETRDCTALSDSDVSEMADICADGSAGYDVGILSKHSGEWVLITRVHEGATKLAGFAFSTLERIGGTPCVLIGLASVKRAPRRDAVLRLLIGDQLRRAVLAFPDEDVLVGTRLLDPAGFAAFDGPGRHRPPSRPQGLGRGAGLGPAPGQALRRRGPHQRPHLRRHRPGRRARRPRPRGRRPVGHRPRGGRLLERARPVPGRRPHRLRLGHGRGPGRPRLPLVLPGGALSRSGHDGAVIVAKAAAACWLRSRS